MNTISTKKYQENFNTYQKLSEEIRKINSRYIVHEENILETYGNITVLSDEEMEPYKIIHEQIDDDILKNKGIVKLHHISIVDENKDNIANLRFYEMVNNTLAHLMLEFKEEKVRNKGIITYIANKFSELYENQFNGYSLFYIYANNRFESMVKWHVKNGHLPKELIEKRLYSDPVTDIHYRKKFELPLNSSNEKITKEFRKLLKTLHPDHGGDSIQFQQVKEDFDTFRDYCNRDVTK
ncbi:J domain-containing protein [Schinkia azotoformans]|uniref:J domain-containing protein n=1 Tax=Schinkia azotoformans TaxID=1454 RepID=UPI002DBB38EA|nr:J domain-containing protein [Schinkia azotoformans]MEC1697756.1 J domain-containing protein [Schinkia azotoformans]